MKGNYSPDFWRLNFTLMGLAVAVVYWLIESLLHTYYWEVAPLPITLLAQSEIDELEMRLVIVTMMVGFGWLAQRGKQHYQVLLEKQSKLNRLLQFLSECNQHVQRLPDEQSLMDAACKAAVEVGKFTFAWVGMQQPDDFRLVAWASADPALDEHVMLLEEHAALVACPGCQKALAEGAAQLCDIAEKADCPASWKEAFLSQGCAHAYALSIKVSGKVVGIFEIYAGEDGVLSQEELTILDEAADDISVALTAIHREAERQQKDKELRNRVEELERFQKATVNREFRIKELRDEIARLKNALALPAGNREENATD